MEPTKTIRFYRVGDEHGCFSNFAPYPVILGGQEWPTSEHYFQAQKFPEKGHRERIRTTRSPMIAARLGRSRKHPIRSDWDQVKFRFMEEAVRAKFTQHEELRKVLLSTGDAEIIEHTKRDRVWGDGGDGTGQNRLGKLLMQVRQELRSNR